MLRFAVDAPCRRYGQARCDGPRDNSGNSDLSDNSGLSDHSDLSEKSGISEKSDNFDNFDKSDSSVLRDIGYEVLDSLDRFHQVVA